MNIPISHGLRHIRAIVSRRAQTFTLERPDDAPGRFGDAQSAESTTSIQRDLHVYAPSEAPQALETGERLSGSLRALALPSEDVQNGDRLTYQGVPYEVVDTIYSPEHGDDADDKLLLRIGLAKRVND